MEILTHTPKIKIVSVWRDDDGGHTLIALIPRVGNYLKVFRDFFNDYVRGWHVGIEGCPGRRFWYRPEVKRNSRYVIVRQDSALDI